MKKILVTGAAGFVGRHVVRHLLDAGHEVHAVDALVKGTGGIDPDDGWPLYNPRDYNYKRFQFYRMDCRDWFFENKEETDFDYAYHLAAIVGGRQMIENNPLAVADDLSIDAAYWQWAQVARPKKSVIFSSSAVYPVYLQREQGWNRLREDMVAFNGFIEPDMTYGWAKLTCEYLARVAYERHGLNSIVYRPFSGYGEDQDDAYPFPAICKRALKEWRRRAAIVWGVDQDVGLVRKEWRPLTVWGSGRQMRDFIHIDDCVAAVAATVDKIDDGGAVNLATGCAVSFIEFAQTVANAAGYDPEIIVTPERPEGVFARVGDPSKLNDLGFRASITLEDGIGRALAYYSKGQ